MITINAPPNGASLVVEDDMLDTDERPQPAEKTSLDQLAKKAGDEIWDQAILSDLANSFVNALQYDEGTGLKNDGKFELTLEKPQQISSRPQINLAPALILRKRSQRGFIRLLKEIEGNIERTGECPSGIETIITAATADSNGKFDAPSQEGKAKSFTSQEVYFPLPANKEQMQIVNYLEHSIGVRVQGPPGTGKSHTITNLICHLLATGKRVLVTSETERALRSLLYFVVETKSSIFSDDLRASEQAKINCGIEHFKALSQEKTVIIRHQLAWPLVLPHKKINSDLAI